MGLTPREGRKLLTPHFTVNCLRRWEFITLISCIRFWTSFFQRRHFLSYWVQLYYRSGNWNNEHKIFIDKNNKDESNHKNNTTEQQTLEFRGISFHKIHKCFKLLHVYTSWGTIPIKPTQSWPPFTPLKPELCAIGAGTTSPGMCKTNLAAETSVLALLHPHPNTRKSPGPSAFF